jgi:hypothetical protein
MRIARANGSLVIINGDGVADAATCSGGEFSADPDRVFAVWDRFTEWASGCTPVPTSRLWCRSSSARRYWPHLRCSRSA